MQSIQRLLSKQNVLLKQCKEMGSAIKRTQERVEVLEIEQAAQNATQTRGTNNTTQDQYKRCTANNKTPSPGRPNMAQVQVGQLCPKNAMGKAPQTTRTSAEEYNIAVTTEEQKAKLKWAQITRLYIPDINKIMPTQIQEIIKKTNNNYETFQDSLRAKANRNSF